MIVHNFLYGFYFGGTGENKLTNFFLISNYVNFNSVTLTITSSFFLCLFYFTTSLVVTVIDQSKSSILKSFVLLLILLFALSAIFMFIFSNLSPNSFSLYFIYLLIMSSFFISILALIYFLIKYPFYLVISFILSFTICYFSYSFIAIYSYNELILAILFSFLTLVIILSLVHLDKRKTIYVIYILKSLIFVVYLSNFSSFLKKIVFLFSTFIYKNTKVTNTSSQLVSSGIKHEISESGLMFGLIFYLIRNLKNKKEQVALRSISSLVILLTFLCISPMFLQAGMILRTSSVIDNKYCIEYSLNNIEHNVTSNFIITEKDSVIYSDDNWNFNIIKTGTYAIKQFNIDDNTDNKCIKELQKDDNLIKK